MSRSVLATWATAFAFIIILIAGWLHAKATIETQLREHVLAMAQLAAERTALTFDGVGETLLSIGDNIRPGDIDQARNLAPDRRQALQALLAQARARNPSLASVALTSASGRLLASSPDHYDASAPGEHMNDLQASQSEKQAMPIISAAFQNPSTHVWNVRMTHRIGSGINGTTGAVLVANVALDEGFTKFFQHYPFAERDVIALHDALDRPLTVFPIQSASVVERIQEPSAGTAMAAESADIVHYSASATDNSTHLVATRKLPRYPFYVAYGKDIDSWLVQWRQEQFLLALAAIVALTVTAAIAAGIQRRLGLTGQLQRVRGDLEDSNNALRTALASAELLAARDQLTGLWNRRTFDQQLESAIARATRHRDTFSLLLLDIDHFKNVNDYYGHVTGDDVLTRFGEVLHERLRQNDVAARWGGEEFVVLADGANLENTRMLAEQMREAIAATSFSPVPRVTVSIGVAEYRPGESGDDLLKRADKALYGAKRNGRNRVIAAEGIQPSQRRLA